MKRIITLLFCFTLLPAMAYGDEPTTQVSAQASTQVNAQTSAQATDQLASQDQSTPPQNNYQVELVVFRNLNTTCNVDDWRQPSLIKPSDAVDLVLPEFSIDKNAPNYCLLPNEKLYLSKEESRLTKSPNYQVMLHIAWTQAIADKWHSKPVHIAGGKNYTIEGEFANEIEGTVTISQGKYITLNTDLFFTEPTQTIEFNHNTVRTEFLNLPEMLSYHFAQNRRMKTGELNYLDNPNFGILIKITPINTV